MSITPKNWKSFQHYKDRAPLWIKLHRGLLDNIDYHLLSPISAKCLPLIWLIASEKEGIIPSADEIAFRLRMSEGEISDVIDELLRRQFLVETDNAEQVEQVGTQAQRLAKSNGFGSRHISDATKRDVWQRDGGACQRCGATDNIEYDHIHPVSKGGNSDLENVQLLCRPCNRSKRVSVDTEPLRMRSLEKSREENKKEEKNIVAKAPMGNTDFETLKRTYPRRAGNYGWKAAEKKYNALVKTGVDPKHIIAAAARLCETLRSKIGTEFIPMPASWLNSEDFTDLAVASFEQEQAPTIDWDDQLARYKRGFQWNAKWYGAEPGAAGCRVPVDALARHGLLPSSEAPSLPPTILNRMQ